MSCYKHNKLLVSCRGNSKYHYYGIRVKPGSQLTNVSDDGSPVTSRSQSTKRSKASQRSENSVSSDNTSPPSVPVSTEEVLISLISVMIAS